jgi:thymidine kinase
MAQTRLEIILGCMFSGKSTELLRRATRYESIGKKVLLVNHSLDTRSDDNVIRTHNKETKIAVKTDTLEYVTTLSGFDSCDVIGIDEAQFFPDLRDFILKVEPLNQVIIVAGLDGDYKREPIGQVLDIIPLCDEVTKLSAMDMMDKDGSPAVFSKRIVSDEDQVLIGATDSYVAVSRKNYLKVTPK